MNLFHRIDYRYSFFDGMCANVYGTLTGGVFLTGFALHLGMSEFLLGMLMSIPSLVTLCQWPGAYFICRTGSRKRLALAAATVSRLIWLPLLVVGMFSFPPAMVRQGLVLILFLMLHAFSSISYVAWISWTSDLVPDEIRGVFFGTRNMLCGAAGIATVLIFGNLLDVISGGASRPAWTFSLPFGCAVFFGLLSSFFLGRISDVPAPIQACGKFLQQILIPMKERNFRRYLLFAACWNLSVYLASPFFSLYFLKELKYSYGFVALLTTIASLVDICAMRFWGTVSDRIKNKAVIQLCGWGVVFLPTLWVFVRPQHVWAPMLIQVLSGAFWAGVTLCSGNLLLRVSARTNRVWFISAYSITAGVGAAIAPIVGGLFLNLLSRHPAVAAGGNFLPLHYLFIASTMLRLLSLGLLRRVQEPQECSLRQAFQYLNPLPVPAGLPGRSPKALNAMRRFLRGIRPVKRPVARQQL